MSETKTSDFESALREKTKYFDGLPVGQRGLGDFFGNGARWAREYTLAEYANPKGQAGLINEIAEQLQSERERCEALVKAVEEIVDVYVEDDDFEKCAVERCRIALKALASYK